MKKSFKLGMLGLAMAAAFPVMAQQADGNWLIRGRLTNLDFRNGQADNMQAVGRVEADNMWIPEFDISYFFTKNIAAELVLTYPQNVDIELNGRNIGAIKALPPSLLLQYHFTYFGAFKPYIGAGVNYTQFTKHDHLLGGLVSVDKSSFGFTAQVGMDYALSKNWYINADAKYVDMATDVHLLGTKVGKVNLDPMLYSIGIGYRF